MGLYRLITIALLLSINSFSFATTTSTQESLNTAAITRTPSQVNSPIENQPPWLMQEVIDLNKQINILESNLVSILSHNTENTHNIQQLTKSLDLLKIEQVKLQSRVELINVENSQQYEEQNARVSDLGLYINMWGVLFALAALFLGITAKNKAIKESKEASEIKVSEWIELQKESIITSVTEEVEKELKVFKDESKTEFEVMAELRKNELDEHSLPF